MTLQAFARLYVVVEAAVDLVPETTWGGRRAQAERFRSFCAEVEPRLRRALVAAYGPDVGSDASADALSWAWERFERVEGMTNPAGYLWRVGQSSAKAALRRTGREVPWSVAADGTDGTGEHAVEPALVAVLSALPHTQRAAVILVHGFGWTLAEAAAALDCRVSTLRNHLARGLA